MSSFAHELEGKNAPEASEFIEPGVFVSTQPTSPPPVGPTILDNILLYSIMFVYGLSLLFAWNALLLSYHYFTHSLNQNPYILDYLLMIFFTVRLAFLFVVPKLLKHLGHFTLILISQAALCLCFVVLGLISIFRSVIPDGVFISILVIVVLASAIFSVIAYQCGLAIAMLVPPKFIQALSAGQGSAGFISSLMKFIAVLVSRDPSVDLGQDSGKYFFMTSACSLIALVSFLPVRRMLPKWTKQRLVILSEEEMSKEPNTVVLEPQELEDQQSALKTHYHIYKMVPKDFWFIFLTMFQYIFIVPAFINMTRSEYWQLYTEEFAFYTVKVFNIVLFLIMGMGDFIGRMMLGFQFAQIKHHMLHPLLIGIRFLMIPFILLGNLWFEGSTDIYPIKRIFTNDAFSIIMLTLFVFTGGYSITHLMMFLPGKIPEHRRKESSLVAVIFMGFGMLCGVSLALLYKFLLRTLSPLA
jgi:hypothetical protein